MNGMKADQLEPGDRFKWMGQPVEVVSKSPLEAGKLRLWIRVGPADRPVTYLPGEEVELEDSE